MFLQDHIKAISFKNEGIFANTKTMTKTALIKHFTEKAEKWFSTFKICFSCIFLKIMHISE